MSANHSRERQPTRVSLADEEGVKQVLVNSVLGTGEGGHVRLRRDEERCAASADEAIAMIREHHSKWLNARR
jgi:hypothetical protein